MATMTPSTLPCPICKKPVSAAAGARADTFPFCGERCRKIDLGQWLGEGYRIPAEDASALLDDAPDDDPEPKG